MLNGKFINVDDFLMFLDGYAITDSDRDFNKRIKFAIDAFLNTSMGRVDLLDVLNFVLNGKHRESPSDNFRIDESYTPKNSVEYAISALVSDDSIYYDSDKLDICKRIYNLIENNVSSIQDTTRSYAIFKIREIINSMTYDSYKAEAREFITRIVEFPT